MVASFTGKNVVIGVTGSIAAFKVAGWVSAIAKEDAKVTVVMTEAAQKFVTPLTFSSLSGTSVYTEMFDGDADTSMAHIILGREADVFIVSPATANTIGKLAHGIADNLVTATALVTRAPVVVCPAMNPAMYEHPANRNNLKRLQEYNYTVVEPESGNVACKDIGKGRLPEWDVVKEVLLKKLSGGELAGKRVLVTAGPTREAIDPARFISNRSSGKMGYSIAREAWRRGAQVQLISGPSLEDIPFGIDCIRIDTAEQMFNAVMEHAPVSDIIVKTAAVSDFKPAVFHPHKVKKEERVDAIELERTPDILQELGRKKQLGQILIGFAAESENHIDGAKRKLVKKNLDLIAVNDISSDSSGFEVDTNKLTLLSSNSRYDLPFAMKSHVAQLLWDKVIELFVA